MKRLVGALAVAGVLATPQAWALNILLSNDDGYQHANIRALYSALTAAGHTVAIAAPQSDQSARGGAFYFGREVHVGQDTDPAFPHSYYVSTQESGLCESAGCSGKTVAIEISGTPVMAVLMGLKKVMPHPNLVIVGPNPGNNVGAINAASGTFNAASVAVQAGIPSLAVSTDLKEQDPQRAAQLLTRLVATLDRHRQPDGRLLPAATGLNVNLPAANPAKGMRLTRIGQYTGFEAAWTDDLAKLFPQQAGKPGISFRYSAPAGPAQQNDEAVWLAKGYVTVSAFNGAPASTVVGSALGNQLRPALLSQEAQ
ncbi:5'/3'-nucleotidase SurE [Pseudomonas silvicola]|nr:5'/3'-nucleotidase SurE [Pseudomonas silvicola]